MESSSRSNQRRLLAVALAALVVAAAGLGAVLAVGRDDETRSGPTAIVPEKPGPFRGNVLPKGVAGSRAPAFELPDARGGTLSTRELAGSPYVVTFLYANCTDVCPVIGQQLRRTLRLLRDDAERVAVVAISVDPKGDTRAAVRDWLRKQRQPPNFHYLIGSRRQLAPVWKGYYVAPQPHDALEGRHTASVWLVDADGRWRTKYSGGNPLGGVPFEPADVAHDLRLLLRES